MGDAVETHQLDHLGVYHEQAPGFGGVMEQKTGHDGVDADRFARTGGPGDEEVEHEGQIGHDRLAGDVRTQSDL
jgi:hypothetical protein